MAHFRAFNTPLPVDFTNPNLPENRLLLRYWRLFESERREPWSSVPTSKIFQILNHLNITLNRQLEIMDIIRAMENEILPVRYNEANREK